MSNDLETFFEGGAISASFPDRAYGTVVGGEIVADPVLRQQKDYTTGDPVVYPNGDPAMQLVVKVQTNLRDDTQPDDDGVRALYIKGQMKKAVGDALKKAGVKTPARGGRLWVRYERDEPVTLKNGRPGNPQKIFQAKYEAPATAAAGDFLAGDTDARSAQPAGPPPAGGASNIATRPPQWPACPPGVDPAKWDRMTWEQREQMYAAFGLPVPQAANAPAAGGFTDEPPF